MFINAKDRKIEEVDYSNIKTNRILNSYSK